MTLPSWHRFWSNEVRLWLGAIAYNRGNLWRRLVLSRRMGHWSLTSLQQRLVKTGDWLVKQARYYWLLLAECDLTGRLFRSMVRRIDALPVPAGLSPARTGEHLDRKETGTERCRASH
jgi:hypothetical protein